MKTTRINTLDGEVEVEWWEKDNFRGRSNKMYTASSTEDIIEGRNLKLLHEIPIPDELVVCDICNDEIKEFPVPVVWSYALCKKCLEGMKKEEEGAA